MNIKYINKETEEFYAGANQSKLLIQQCNKCGEHVFYPRKFCPKDLGELTFVEASGKGRILTYSIVMMDGLPRFRDMTPYVAAIVELDEGPTMSTRIVIDNSEAVFIGQKVEVIFEQQEEQKIPLFRPSENA